MAHTLRKLRLEVLIPKCGRRLVSGSVLFSQILARSPRYVCTPTCRASSSPIGWSQGKSDETVFRSGSFPHVASPECRPCRRNDSLCTTHRKNKPGPTTKKERSRSGGRPTFFSTPADPAIHFDVRSRAYGDSQGTEKQNIPHISHQATGAFPSEQCRRPGESLLSHFAILCYINARIPRERSIARLVLVWLSPLLPDGDPGSW